MVLVIYEDPGPRSMLKDSKQEGIQMCKISHSPGNHATVGAKTLCRDLDDYFIDRIVKKEKLPQASRGNTKPDNRLILLNEVSFKKKRKREEGR
jgi:hypothetical protein